MPRLRAIQNSFTSGEISDLLLARNDLKSYSNAAKLMRNVVVIPQGGFSTRPGTEFTALVAEKSAGVYSNTRSLEFKFSTEQTYLIVFSHLKATIYKDGVSQKVLVTPYTSDDLIADFDSEGDIIHTGVSWVQDLDTLLVFHEDYPPQRIQRQGSHTAWAIAEFELKNVERREFADGTYGARITGATPSAVNGTSADIANINDGDTGTTGTATTNITTGATYNLRLVMQLDFGAVTEFGAVEIDTLGQGGAGYRMGLVYSDDAVTWRALGAERDFISSVSQSWTYVKDFSARYIGIITETGVLPRDHTCAGINCFGRDVGVDEVQTVFFDDSSTTTEWLAGDVFSILIQDEESTNITFDFNAGILAAKIVDAIETIPSISNGDITISVDQTASKGATFTITFSNDSGGKSWGSIFINKVTVTLNTKASVEIETRGRRPGEPVWSAVRGYPRSGLFFQDRLWLGGSKSLPHFIWATRATTIDDFNVELADADYGISIACDSSDVPAVLNLVAGRHLQIFTTSSEFYIPISEVDKITPANVVLRQTSERGSQPGVNVVEVEGATIFLQRGSKTLREFIFADVELAYQSRNLSLLSSHLILSPVAMALKKSTTTDDADYIYLVNGDGSMTIICILKSEEVIAFTHWSTQGHFVDVTTVLDDVFVIVRRTIDGVATNLIEKLNVNCLTDSAVYDTALGTPASSAAIAHLGATDTVQAILDGVPQVEKAMVAGVLTFDRDAATSYEVGLKWPEVDSIDNPGLAWIVKTLPIEVGLPDGASMGRKRRVVDIAARLYQTTALTVNGNDFNFRPFGSSVLNVAVAEYTGMKRLRGLRGYDFDGSLTLGSSVPSKATILGFSFGVAI